MYIDKRRGKGTQTKREGKEEERKRMKKKR
jgi:hypothetical protein